MEPPQNRNNNNEGNGQPNEWYNNNHFFAFCKLMAIAMLYGTYFFVTTNSSKTVEDGLQQQAKNNENTSGNLLILIVGRLAVFGIMHTMLNHYEDELDRAIDQARQAILHYFNILIPVDIPQLVMVKVDQERVDNGAQCTICLETFELDEDVAKLDCQHIFHRACIMPWLQLRNNTCPVCRAKMNRDFTEQMHNTIVNAAAHGIESIVQAVDYGNERIRQAFRMVGLRQAMDNGTELNRQAIANAQQQMMVQFLQEQANEGGDTFEMVGRRIDNLIRDGMRHLDELYDSDTDDSD